MESIDFELQDQLDPFDDWDATMAGAGIVPSVRDLTHLSSQEQAALFAAEEKAATNLARAVGLPQAHDLLGHDRSHGLTEEMQRRLLEAVNPGPVSQDALARLVTVIGLLPEEWQHAGPMCGYNAVECAAFYGVTDPNAPLGLLARTIALRRWRAGQGPVDTSAAATQITAAAQAPVMIIDGLPAFDGPAFEELIAFIDDLPW